VRNMGEVVLICNRKFRERKEVWNRPSVYGPQAGRRHLNRQNVRYLAMSEGRSFAKRDQLKRLDASFDCNSSSKSLRQYKKNGWRGAKEATPGVKFVNRPCPIYLERLFRSAFRAVPDLHGRQSCSDP